MSAADDHVLDEVDAYLHGVLNRENSQFIEQHCRECPICRVALAEARKRLVVMHSLAPVEPSDELLARTAGQVEKSRRPRFHWQQIAWMSVTAAAVIIGCFHLYFANLKPSPYNLTILGQTELLSGSEASLRVLLTSYPAQRPLANKVVRIELAGKDGSPPIRLASFTTDTTGTGQPHIKLPDWPDGDYTLHVQADTGYSSEQVQSTVRLRRAWQVMLTTDKPVYQPGQVIHLRSLALRSFDQKPRAGENVVFTIRDPKGNTIFRKKDVTSRFGLASADCPLAEEITEGSYRIECQLGDSPSSTTVEVKRYTLPKIKVELTTDHPYYQPGQKVTGVLNATYFFGQAVADAHVTVQMRAKDISTSELGQSVVRTNAQGRADFELLLPESFVGRLHQQDPATIELTALVRDTAGQEQSQTVSRIVTTQAIHVEVLPEGGKLVKGLANRIYVVATYPDGRPASVRIAMEGSERELQTDDQGVASFEHKPTRHEIELTLRATDAAGNVGRREVKLSCGEVQHDFLIRTDKASYRSGETMQVTAIATSGTTIFLDLVQAGQTIATESLAATNGQVTHAVDLPPNLRGPLRVCAYRLNEAGWPVRKERLVYIHPAQALNLTAKWDQAEYRPGGKARLAFTLTDHQQRPVVGALSLSVVDESVFSVLGSRSCLENSFAAIEQELMQPVYAIYPWSPRLSQSLPGEKRERLEQALFSATNHIAKDTFARLAPFAEGEESLRRLLEVIKRPDWRELADRMQISPKIVNMLENVDGAHSLTATSYPSKEREVRQTKTNLLGTVFGAWVILGLISFILFLTHLNSLRIVEFLVVLFIIGILVSLLLPAVQSAREASRRSQAQNDLRNLDLAAQNMMDQDRMDPTTTTPPRLRQWFPETLLWRPEIITDEQGQAKLELDLADSITTWRVAASAVSAEGKLAAIEEPLRVFQPFFVDINLPVSVTRRDEIAVPIVVYNYLEQPQTVKLKVTADPAIKFLEETEMQLELQPGEVRSLSCRLLAEKVGSSKLQVLATSGEVSDAVQRVLSVLPDGQLVERVHNGSLADPAECEITIPEDAIEGSMKSLLKIYPSNFSQVVESIDAILQRPYGCFEQTSSATYPNVLALDYLRRTNKNVPAIEARAQEYIHLGYQRLLSFEILGGGFDWFGHPPANRTLTAYGLMEFEDMARVHAVDPQLIERTRAWLLGQQNGDGSWEPESHRLHEDPTQSNRKLAKLSTTAYISRAAYSSHAIDERAMRAKAFLVSHTPDTIGDPYVLALVCNALLALKADEASIQPYMRQLLTMKRVSIDLKTAWWEAPDRGTTFYGTGQSGHVETTALSVLALLKAKAEPTTARAALLWLIQQKDSRGTWHSTQATILALKALLAGMHEPRADEKPRLVKVLIDGQPEQELSITADQAEVVQQLDLSSLLTTGKHKIAISEQGSQPSNYQLTTRYHLPQQQSDEKRDTLAIEVAYDRQELAVHDRVKATVMVTNKSAANVPMVLLDLPIPAGFAVDSAELTALVNTRQIAKYQVTPQSVIVYLRELSPDKPWTVTYSLQATIPANITIPAAKVSEYYTPENRAESKPTAIGVR